MDVEAVELRRQRRAGPGGRLLAQATPRATKVECRLTFVEGRTDSRSMHEPGAPGDDAYMTPPTQSIAGISAVGLYRIDPTNSSITFKTRHLFGLGRVRGSFELHDGEIHFADPVSGSWVEARVSTASFQTGSSARDSSVLSSRLLDAYGHPFITFTAAAPPGLGLGSFNEAWALRGQLTVCGTTAPLGLTIEELEATTAGLRLRATCQVDRYDFGVTKAKGWAGRHLQLYVEVVATRVPSRSQGPGPRAQRSRNGAAAGINRLFRRAPEFVARSMAKTSKKTRREQ